MAGARLHRAEPGAPGAPDEGRCRADPHCTQRRRWPSLSYPLYFSRCSAVPAASARVTRHEAISQHGAVKTTNFMSYAQAEKVAKLATYSNAVAASKRRRTSRRSPSSRRSTSSSHKAAPAGGSSPGAAAAAATGRRPLRQPLRRPLRPPPGSGRCRSDATSTNTPDWACIRQHESGDNYAEGNGGAYQFADGTWTV